MSKSATAKTNVVLVDAFVNARTPPPKVADTLTYGAPVTVIDPVSLLRARVVPPSDSVMVKSVPLTFTVLTKYNVFSIVPPNVDPVKVIGIST